MKTLHQSPIDPAFVQNPYPFYAKARRTGDLFFWADYDMPCAVSHAAVHALLRDRRFGRECPAERVTPPPAHLAPFYAVEAHSMLELEPPHHTRLRGLVTRAFTSRRVNALAPFIAALSHDLIDRMPTDAPFDLLPGFATPIPILTICRLLGVPGDMADQLLKWSHDMVAMYQATRSRPTEDAAARAATEFSDFMQSYINKRRSDPQDDLITQLITAEEAGEKLSTQELITTCILLLNAGHEATVHALANATKCLIEHDKPDIDDATIEETLRFDPPLHMFTRYAYEDITAFGHTFQRGDQIALLLGAAGRDPAIWTNSDRFLPERPTKPHLAFGGGLHFCVGAPLARLELATALPILFSRLPNLRLAAPPVYANTYHFHALTRLMLHA
ncbi:cytochrome P450 [Rhodobacteraceae bacterium D3-12]|nr:cytochrome P450 [Rhodobacteraceae bacterium D3-12]